METLPARVYTNPAISVCTLIHTGGSVRRLPGAGGNEEGGEGVNPFSSANKYRNKKIEIDGIIFDSKKEAKHYLDLKAQKAAGAITDFKMQVPFELVPKQTETVTVFDAKGRPKQKERVVELAVKYVADFVVYFPDGEVSVIDVKGMRLADYKIKRKLMRHVHGITIKEL